MTWIKITPETLPIVDSWGDSEPVLVCADDKTIYWRTLRRNGNCYKWHDEEYIDFGLDSYTHWQPLPEPPKDE